MAQTLLTSPKNTTSSSRLTGSETNKRISSSLTLTTDSTTPPPGSKTPAQEEDGEFGRDNKPFRGELERDGRSTGEKLGRDNNPISGELERDGRSTGEKLGRDGELEGDGQATGEKLGRDGELEGDGQAPGEKLGRGPVGKESGRDRSERKDKDGEFGLPDGLANEDKMSARLSKVVGVLTAEKFSSVSDSEPDSLIASEISLTAKLSGPIGMTIGLAPVDSKSAVKDRLKSIEPDNSILRNSAILKDNLEKKVKNNENIDNTKITEKTNCWQSKNVHSYLKRNFKCSLITKSFEEQKVRRKKLLLSHKTFKSPD